MRELTLEELELISGGSTTVDEIVVVADGDGDGGGDWGDYGDYGDGGGGSGGDSGSDSGEQSPPENEHPCEANAVADIDTDIKAKDASDGKSGTSQPEYGATIASADGKFYTSEIRTGQSYDDANPPSTSIGPPAGFTWAQVTGTVHSHPPSGDAAADIRNQAPSDGDWQSADEAVRRGADPSNFTMYVIDKDGNMRAFDYKSPADRGATPTNPSGNQNTGASGTPVTPGAGGCG